MTRIAWWLMEKLSTLLDLAERDVLYGDLSESGEPAGAAFIQTIGLVARRQAELWRHWRPWAAALALAAPLAIVLAVFSQSVANHSAIYAWLYINNWTPLYLTNATARADLLHELTEVLLDYLLLAGVSCAAGFATGWISRRTAWLSGTLLCLIGILLNAAAPAAHPPWHAAVFSVTFYRVMFPLIVQTTLVCLPAAWAIHRSHHSTN